LNDDEPAILDIRHATKRFEGLVAIDHATLEIRPRSITALIGPNGAGKTTLFNIISGFLRPDRGTIWFRGQSIGGKSPFRITRSGLVRTFQLTKALTRMSVLENMMLAASAQPGEHLAGLWFRPGSTRRREREVRERAMDQLRLFRLDHMADEYAGTLSGGQRKLLELARALMTDPDLVLLDEPMAGVNPTLGLQLLEHMVGLRDRADVTFFFIEHDMEVVMSYAERVIVMAEGRVIADGTADSIRAHPAVIDAYLGTALEDRNS
jgi:neutral amino acid transport system ATP-binding protein